VEATKQKGGLTIVPHIGMGSTWQLAAAVAEVRGGGVSIPMTIVNRLNRDRVSTKFVVAQRVGKSQPPGRFADAVHVLDDLLFRSGGQKKDIILLSPVEIEAGLGVQMLACAETIAGARELSEHPIRMLSESSR